MKTLANCKPTEFMKQTAKIAKQVEQWLKVTDLQKIRSELPELKPLTKDMDKDERNATFLENKAISEEFAKQKTRKMIESIFVEHPEETLAILALICFVEPKDVDKHTMEEYFEGLTELINSRAVIGFFTSLVQLGQTNISQD